MRIIDIKGNLHDPHVLDILSHSQYMPTEEKLKDLADTYESDPNTYAFSCVDNNCIIGVVVFKRLTTSTFEIVSIAVAPAFRGQGIGSKLISFAANTLKCAEVSAETDDDAVGFYRSGRGRGQRYLAFTFFYFTRFHRNAALCQRKQVGERFARGSKPAVQTVVIAHHRAGIQ